MLSHLVRRNAGIKRRKLAYFGWDSFKVYCECSNFTNVFCGLGMSATMLGRTSCGINCRLKFPADDLKVIPVRHKKYRNMTGIIVTLYLTLPFAAAQNERVCERSQTKFYGRLLRSLRH